MRTLGIEFAAANAISTVIEWYDFLSLHNAMAGLVFNKIYFPITLIHSWARFSPF